MTIKLGTLLCYSMSSATLGQLKFLEDIEWMSEHSKINPSF